MPLPYLPLLVLPLTRCRSARVREVLSGMRAAERRVAGAEGELISQFGDNMRLIGALATGLSGLLALVTGAGGVLLCRLAVWRG